MTEFLTILLGVVVVSLSISLIAMIIAWSILDEEQ